jgi:hypothetical protein
MASSAAEPRMGNFVPAPGALFGFLILGGLAVWALPEIAEDLPHPGRLEQARYASACLGVLILTGAYITVVSTTERDLDRAWMIPTVVYAAGLAIVKFILSPTAFELSTGTGLGGFVTAGLVVMPLYIAAMVLIYSLAGRRRGRWSLSSRVGLSVGFAVGAVVTRLLVALILGTADQYLDDFIWQGLVLPLIVAIASFAVSLSFDLSGSAMRRALHAGLAVIVTHHLLWVLYMYLLFA